jgi:hypothetical protein
MAIQRCGFLQFLYYPSSSDYLADLLDCETFDWISQWWNDPLSDWLNQPCVEAIGEDEWWDKEECI